MNKDKKTGSLIIAAGVLFIIAALSLSAYNGYTENKAERLSSKALASLEMDKITADADFDKETPPDYIINPDMLMPTKTIDGKEYIGSLTIASADLALPVIKEWSYENLKIAPCVYEGTAYKNNFIIAAHNYKKHFAVLGALEENDIITFKDMAGNVFNYKVLYKEILDGSAIEEMTSGDWDLTLFTCTYGGATRITIRCSLIK